jgi:ethanolamine permease
MVIALSVGELASIYPSAPGVRTYFKATFGDRPSLTLVYLYLIFVVLIAGLEGFVFSQVVSAVFPRTLPMVTITVLIVFVAAINLIGFELPRGLQIFTTSISVLLIVISGILGLFHAKVSLTEIFSPKDTLRQAMMLPALAGMSVFLYTGFEWVTPLGLRAKAYERKVPFSMPATVLVLFLAYSLFVIGTASQLAPAAIARTPVPQIPYFSTLYGTMGPYLALLLSVMAIFSTFNAGILGGSQLIFMLAQEGQLPEWCGAVSLRTGCPVGAILVLGGLALTAGAGILLFRLEIVAALIGASIMCLIYAAFMVAVLKLRRDKPNVRRPFRTPVFQFVQGALAVILLIMGVQTLLSEPGLGLRCCLGALLSATLALLLTWRSSSMRMLPSPKTSAAANQL